MFLILASSHIGGDILQVLCFVPDFSLFCFCVSFSLWPKKSRRGPYEPLLAAQLPLYWVPGLSTILVFYKGPGTVTYYIGNWAVGALSKLLQGA